MERFITIGVAGHIDHGKTALTRALTGIETDRLKEEKERAISIENGYAYFDIGQGRRAAVIDVPGHEKFIKKMIAGVAGIDMIVVVIAADEGVMPQTEEHLTILQFLNIKHAIVALTKCDLVDEEWLTLVREDVGKVLSKKGYVDVPIFEVDSLSMRGIPELKQEIIEQSAHIKTKNSNESFRLPIDDIFTIKGQGTIVRGTVFNGSVRATDEVTILPRGQKARMRQLQVHHEQKQEAYASQRVAINLAGVTRRQVKRGDVLVSSNLYKPTKRIDVYIETIADLKYQLKQRTSLMCHLGTAAVMGSLILLDRNQLNADEGVYCQLELEYPIVAKRGDRLILRRPSPVETIGGGWIIDANAEKHRHGQKTVESLEKAAHGTPKERLVDILKENQVLSYQELMQEVNLKEDEFTTLLEELKESGDVLTIGKDLFTEASQFSRMKESLLQRLSAYHESYPLRTGMNRAEWLASPNIEDHLVKFVAAELERDGIIQTKGAVVQLADFTPHFPHEWSKKMASIQEDIEKQGIMADPWQSICSGYQMPEDLAAELRSYFINQGVAVSFDDATLVSKKAVDEGIQLMKEGTGSEFTLQEAKEILGLSRKYLIPFLEVCDKLPVTKRQDNKRVWISK